MSDRARLVQPAGGNDHDRRVVVVTVPTSDAKRATTLATTKAADLRQMWRNDARVTPWRGTAWGVVSAVNTYTQHAHPGS